MEINSIKLHVDGDNNYLIKQVYGSHSKDR